MKFRVMESEGDLASWAHTLLLADPRRIVVEKDRGAASDLRPQRTLPGPGRWRRAVGVLWSLAGGPADTPEQLSHVYDGIFLLLRQSASSTA